MLKDKIDFSLITAMQKQFHTHTKSSISSRYLLADISIFKMIRGIYTFANAIVLVDGVIEELESWHC